MRVKTQRRRAMAGKVIGEFSLKGRERLKASASIGSARRASCNSRTAAT